MGDSTLKVYFRQLVGRCLKEWILYLGLVSTVASFFPKMQPAWRIRPIGLAIVVLGFLRASYFVWKDLWSKVVREEEQRGHFIADLVALVEENVRVASGNTLAWQATLLSDVSLDIGNLVRFVSDDGCRRSLEALCGKIRSAKEIYCSLQTIPLGSHIHPEQLALEDLCREIREIGTGVIERLRGEAGYP